MSGNIRKLAAAALGVGALVVSGTTPATASSHGNGAVVDRFRGCEDYGFAEVCGNFQTVTNITETPSGNTNYIANGKYDYTVTFDDGETYSTDGRFHHKYLGKKGEAHVFHGRGSDSTTGSFGTCTYDFAYHYANGQWQYDDFEFNCN